MIPPRHPERCPVLVTLASTTGLCPCCGERVARLTGRRGATKAETYACQTCGRFEYGTEAPSLPLVVPRGPGPPEPPRPLVPDVPRDPRWN